MADPGGTLRYNEKTGIAHVMTGQGWRELRGEEAQTAVEAAKEGYTGAAIVGMVDALTFGLVDSPKMQATRQQYPTMTSGIPAAADAAGAVTGVGALAKAGGSALVRQVAGRTAKERVQQQIGEQTGEAAARMGVPGGGGLGGDSVGAAAGDMDARGWIRRTSDRILTEFAGDPQDLTSAQRRLLESGTPQRIGFQFLPGQATGRNLLSEAARSDPIVSGAFDGIYAGNRAAGNRITRKAIGIDEGEDFGLSEMGQAADRFSNEFDSLGQRIGDIQIPADQYQKINKVVGADDDLQALAADAGIDVLDEAGGRSAVVISGDQALSLRSLLNDASSSAWQQGNALRAQRIDQSIDQIDEIIESVMPDDFRAEYGKLRMQYKVFKQLEKTGSLRPDGSINFESLAGAGKLRKAFKRDFGRSDVASSANLPPEIRDFLDFTKTASAFRGNVGDSGTATRLGIMQALTNPKQAAARFYIRSQLKRMADDENTALGITPDPTDQ